MSQTTRNEGKAAPDLPSVRSAIDNLDAKLVAIISERAELVKMVGLAKRSTGTAVYAPERERQVIARAVERNSGPLNNNTIEAIFRELMSGSFALQIPLRISYLGPRGSFSHLATIRHFGSSVELGEMHTIAAVVQSVMRGHYDHGVIPYENSSGGSIMEALDAMLGSDAQVCSEALLNVEHNLLANCAPEEIKSIHSKPEVFLQCRSWLATKFPHCSLVAEASTSTAVALAAENTHLGFAAIGSALAGELCGVRKLFTSIQDSAGNVTRFLIVGKKGSATPTGFDRTTMNFDLREERPGALAEVLDAFRENGVNLLHLDKRPSGQRDWHYSFFIDCEGHHLDASVLASITKAREACSTFRILGSYPRAERIYLSNL